MKLPIVTLASLLLCLPMTLAQASSSEEASAPMSDRTQAGLRGLVKSVTETYASGATAQIHFEHTTLYDSSGRVLSTRTRNSDGSYWVTRNEYSNSGQLLKSASGAEGQILSETRYSYDSQSRLVKITSDNNPDVPILFHYDEQGRKTKTQTSCPSDYRPNFATGGSPFDSVDSAPNLPGGGVTTTVYDEHDRPVEVQVRDSNGELVTRALRTYNAEGRISDEKQVYENFIAMTPPDTRQKMIDESGLSPEQLQQELPPHIAK